MADALIDVERKIFDWCGHLSVPRWVDEKAYSNCRACNTKMDGFIKKNSHHCRLCGHMFCSACTQKYHVPLIFRIKAKDGPARVCMSCVDGCLAEKEKAALAPKHDLAVSKLSVSALATSSITSSLRSLAEVLEIEPPDTWQEESAFTACPKCSASKCKTNNCRVCGLRYCEKCTSKMDIPACFERKAKDGPARVCDPCRYKVVSQGYKLVERLSGTQGAIRALHSQGSTVGKTPSSPSNASSGPASIYASRSGKDRRQTSLAPKCSVPGCVGTASGAGLATGRCAAHVDKAEEEKTPPQELKIIVKKEGANDNLCTLSIPHGETSLHLIDVLFKKAAPQTEPYEFAFRGAPVPEAFHHVFLAKHLGGTLLIRPKRKPNLVTLDEAPEADDAEESYVEVGGGDGGDVPPAQVNPFKRDPVREAEHARLTAAKMKPVQAPTKVVEFKRPTRSQTVLIVRKPAAAAAAAGEGGAPKASLAADDNGASASASASVVPAGGNIDQLLKDRAKMFV